MVEIIPAIMPVSFDDLCEKLSRVKGLASVVQIDVMEKWQRLAVVTSGAISYGRPCDAQFRQQKTTSA